MSLENKNEKDSLIEQRIHKLLSDNPEELDEIDEYLEAVEEEYSGDVQEFAFREAIRCGAFTYVEENVDCFDLNDEVDCSSYLNETDDEDMQELLIDHGAFRSMDEYCDYRFAMESVNGEIIAFDSELQREAFMKYLEYTGLTEEKLIEILTEDYAWDEDEDEDFTEELDRDVQEDMDSLGVTVKDGVITFSDCWGDVGYGTRDLLEELGWECEFEGESWKLQTTGVYYIR